MFTEKKTPVPDTMLVATVSNAVERGMLVDLLEQADIPCIVRPRYGLDPLPVLAGSSVLGEEIYVDAAQAEDALDLIHAFTAGEYVAEDETPGQEDGQL